MEKQGPLETKEILRISMQIASGLAAAHAQGLVHRDIKPSNILLEDTVERTLLTDFGLARIVDDVSMTRTGIVAGTPHYMSPEQARGEPVDSRSDLFSLGSVMYFMCTGRPPFRADRALAVLNRICRDPHQSVWQIDPELPDELSDLIDRLLEKQPRHRYSSAAEVEDLLSGLLAGRPSLIPHGSRRQTVRRWYRKNRKRVVHAAWALATTATIGLVVGLAAVGVNQGWFAGDEAAVHSPVEPGEAPAGGDGGMTNLTELGALSAAALDAQMSDVENKLQQLEADNPRHFLRAGHGDWSEEVSSIQRELSQLEQPVEYLSNPKGEKR